MVQLKESPACDCGAREETLRHYLYHCPLYDDARLILTDVGATTLPLNSLLSGHPCYNPKENEKLCIAVQKYIEKTGRFENQA